MNFEFRNTQHKRTKAWPPSRFYFPTPETECRLCFTRCVRQQFWHSSMYGTSRTTGFSRHCEFYLCHSRRDRRLTQSRAFRCQIWWKKKLNSHGRHHVQCDDTTRCNDRFNRLRSHLRSSQAASRESGSAAERSAPRPPGQCSRVAAAAGAAVPPDATALSSTTSFAKASSPRRIQDPQSALC